MSRALAGLKGAVSVSALFLVLRALGLSSLNLEQGLGHVVDSHGSGSIVWWIGLGWHLLNGMLLALLLAWILTKLRCGGAKDGAIAGFVFWFFSSLAIGAFPTLNILLPNDARGAGPFAIYCGLITFYVWMAAHLLFGAIVGKTVAEPIR